MSEEDYPNQRGVSEQEPLSAGAEAPEFTLPTTPDQTVSLSEFSGQPVVLAFYPADWRDRKSVV